MKKNILSIRLSDRELEMLSQCAEAQGTEKGSFIREMIHDRHRKLFPYYKIKGRAIRDPNAPTYARKEKDEELTKEQICEQMGGKIIDQGNKKVCVISSLNRMTGKEYIASTIPLENVNKKMLTDE